MGMPTHLALNVYTGVLVLDNSAQESRLAQRDSTGKLTETLMMLDPSPSGEFDPVEVTAAWQYFSNKPGIHDGSTITVYGFWGYPPNGDRPAIHVVRA